jgi:hypothetical protein
MEACSKPVTQARAGTKTSGYFFKKSSLQILRVANLLGKHVFFQFIIFWGKHLNLRQL